MPLNRLLHRLADWSAGLSICCAGAQELKEVVSLCLQKDPLERPSAERLLKHKFFKVRGLRVQGWECW